MQSAVDTNPDPPALGVALVVEDEILLRIVQADQLRRLGFTVLEAKSGQDALTVLKTVEGVTVVVTDVDMPGDTDGAALASWLRQERPNIKVISAFESNKMVGTVPLCKTLGAFRVNRNASTPPFEEASPPLKRVRPVSPA